MILNTPQFQMISQSMDALWMKQRVLSDNIANMNTPNYKSKYVEFTEVLNQQQCKSHLHNYALKERGIETPGAGESIVLAEVKEDKTTSINADGNNVNVEGDLMEFDRTQIQYKYLTEKVNSDMRRLRQVMGDSKR